MMCALNFTFEQGLAVTTLVNAAVVTYIGYQQYRTSVSQKELAEAKHRADLFDRRFAVFQAAQKVLSKIFADGSCEYIDVHGFTPWTQQAYFLFDQDVYDYMIEIRSWMIKLASAKTQLDGREDQANRQELIESQHAAMVWLTDQLDTTKQGIFPRFKPYLRH